MAVDDAYKLDLFQSFLGQRVMNSLAFSRKAETATTQAECAALALDWKNFLIQFQAASLTHVSWRMVQLSGAGVTYSAVDCTREGGEAFEGAYTGTLVGAMAGEALPPQCARVTTLMTGLVGRRRRGRFYQAGIIEGITQDGVFGSGEMATHQALWDAQLAQYSPGGTDPTWSVGVWSQRIATGCEPSGAHPHNMTNVSTPNPTDAFRPVSVFRCRNIVYTQRKRTIGVGA